MRVASQFERWKQIALPPWLLRSLSTLTRKRASADRARRPIEPPTRRPAQNLPPVVLRGRLAIRAVETNRFAPLPPALAQHADQEARQRGSRPPPDRAAHTPPSAEPPARRATGPPRDSSGGNKSLCPLASCARSAR